METNREDGRPAAPQVVGKIFGMIMVVLYVGLGTTIIFKASEFQIMSPGYATAFGIILIAYGALRAYKLFRKYYAEPSE